MAAEFNNLFTLARSKLHLSVGSKDNCSLHRWVLLKNSIINSPSLTSSSASELPEATPTYPDEEYDDENADEVLGSLAVHNFMFPDAGNLVESQPIDVKTSEAQWLDSLLETLGDDDEDDFGADSDPQILPADEDDDHLFSPSASPMSSSDDLPMHHYYRSPSIPVTYPVPYPPFQPPLSHSYDFSPPFESSLSSLPAPYDDPLPYYDSDDVDYLSVPDAIEDTSDDESDSPPTPSLGMSSSSLSLDAASIPLPQENSRLRHAVPRVYIDEDPYCYPFELDPLPFPDDVHTTYNPYQEC